MRGRRRLAGLLAVLSAVFLAGVGQAQLAPLTAAPALPPQPGVAAAPCSASPGKPGSFTMVTSQTDHSGVAPSYEVTQDGWLPCRLFRANDGQNIDRSSDTGRTWQPVFADSVSNLTTRQPFALGAMVTAGHDGVVLGERGNGDATVRSGDGGATWHLGSGLEGDQVVEAAFAPSDPKVGYAVVATATCVLTGEACTDAIRGVARTRDSGANWTLATGSVPSADACTIGVLPPCRKLQVTVDPTDPDHAAVLIGYTSESSAILVTHNGGTSWAPITEHGSPTHFSSSAVFAVAAIAVTTSTDFGHLLYTIDAGGYVSLVDDDADALIAFPGQLGAAMSSPVIAVDPGKPERVVVAGVVTPPVGVNGSAVEVVSSDDGFTSTRRGTSILNGLASATLGVATPMWPSESTLLDGARVLQYDRAGGFLLSIHEDCNNNILDCGHLGWSQRQSYWHVVPAAPPPPPSPAGGGGASGGGGNGGGGAPVTEPLPALTTCPLLPGPGAPIYGNLAFDGEHLLYTYVEQGPAAVIHKVDPHTCKYVGDIAVHLDPATFGQYTGATSIDEMSYDPNHNQIIAALLGSPLGLVVAAVTVTGHGTGLTSPDSAVAEPLYRNACTWLLTYDFSDDTIWGCSANNDAMAHLTRTGTTIPSCLDRGGVQYPGTWVLGNAGHLYLQYENDTDIQEMDDRTCALGTTYTHRVFAEPGGEDEQLACDSVTFGASSGHTPPTTVLWLRDAEALSVTAYAIRDGVCPFPTRSVYQGDPSVWTGQSANLCSTVTLLGHDKPLPDLPVDFTVGGIPVGSGTTGPDGQACIQPVISLQPGTYPVRAAFAGTAEYRASDASGTLVVYGPPPPAPPPPGPPPKPAPPPPFIQPPLPGPGQVISQIVPASRQAAQAAQIQVQPAPQGMSAPQPVVSAQREQQLQPAFAYAVQSQPEAELNPENAYEMSALQESPGAASARRAELAGGALALLAGMTAAFSWVLRTAWARERSDLDRRRRRRQRR